MLSFIGSSDPSTSKGEGPVLSMLTHEEFDRAYLFYNSSLQSNTDRTLEAIKKLDNPPEIEPVLLDISDPTDIQALLKLMRDWYYENEKLISVADVAISTASGTTSMSIVWTFLISSGEIKARAMYVRDPTKLAEGQPRIVQIDFSDPCFPRITQRQRTKVVRIKDKSLNIFDIARSLNIIGNSEALVKAMERTISYAQSNRRKKPILITGESGTGKTSFAELYHRYSSRSEKPFFIIDCSTIGENLALSKLFGHKKGSFTGATKDLKGVFEEASGGTLFLDEVHNLKLDVQNMLLRAIEYNMITPIGCNKEIQVDVQVICATNQNLEALVSKGIFKQDLFFRIKSRCINIPALRERAGDIPILCEHFLKDTGKTITPGAVNMLQRMYWKGNIRMLDEEIDNLVQSTDSNEITEDDVATLNESDENLAAFLPVPREGFKLDEYICKIEKALIEKAIEQANGTQTEAAKLLDLKPSTLSDRMKKHDLRGK